MEDDELDEEARHGWLVEGRMQANFARLVVVDTEPNGLATPAAGAASPANGGPHATLEMPLVEPLEYLAQVIGAASRREDFVSGISVLSDARLLTADEVVQQAPRPTVSAAGIVGHGPHHGSRGVEKHVVEPQAQSRWSTAKADHGAPVVGDRKSDRHSQFARERLRQRSRLFHQHLAGGQTARGGWLGLEQQQQAGGSVGSHCLEILARRLLDSS